MKEGPLKNILRFLKNKIYYKTFAHISIFVQKFIRTVDEQNYYMSRAIVVNQVNNEAFAKYKNLYNGKDIAIIATGPSLNKYVPLENTINIAVNRAFLHEKVKADYIFMQDYNAVKDYIEQANEDQYRNIPKFYGIFHNHIYGFKEFKVTSIPESIAIRHNAKRYYAYLNRSGKAYFQREIDKNWIDGNGGIAFAAIQFALFTNPRRIYIVGCDCSSGYYNGKKGPQCKFLVNYWKKLKAFAQEFYPETEIISVNPVGLKGIFTDLEQ